MGLKCWWAQESCKLCMVPGMHHSSAAEDQVGLTGLLCVVGLQEQQMYGLNLLCFDDDQQISGESGPDRLLPVLLLLLPVSSAVVHDHTASCRGGWLPSAA